MYNEVFLVSIGEIHEPPNVYSNFEDAEKVFLENLISRMTKSIGGFFYTISVVTVDKQWKHKVRYTGSSSIIGKEKVISVQREWSKFGDEKEFSFKFPINL